MRTHPLSRRISVVLAPIMLAASAQGQTSQPPPSNVESELMQMRTENGVIREQLNRLEEQQKALLRLIDELQRRLDGKPAPIAYAPPPAPPPPEPEPPAQTPAPAKLPPRQQQPAPDRN